MTAPELQAEAAPDLAPDAAGQVCGPQLPTMQDLWLAQDAPCEANRAGCSDAVYDRLILERQQAEAAYLDGYDRDLELGQQLDFADQLAASLAYPEAELEL